MCAVGFGILHQRVQFQHIKIKSYFRCYHCTLQCLQKVEREQGDELDMEYWRSGEETEEQDYIVVHEEDIVAGEDIHTAAEEVTA